MNVRARDIRIILFIVGGALYKTELYPHIEIYASSSVHIRNEMVKFVSR